VFVLIFVRKIFDRILPWVQKKTSFPGGVLNLILISGFLGAAFTEYIGIHAIFGAFMVGIAVGDSAHLSEKTREIIHQFVTNIFAPLFFVSIGLRVDFISNFNIEIVLIILLLSFAGKVIGCGIGALWAGMSKTDALIVGFGLNSRGTMEIILGLLALQFGLIHETVFVALVVMAILTSIISAPVMNYFLKKREAANFNDIILPELVFFTNAETKDEVIAELINHTSSYLGIKSDEIYREVKKREELVPTGIANYLALPHAKLKIKKPVAAIAINDKGIDFDAEDKLNSRIIILLLSPLSDNKMQLKLLSEIASKFSSREKAEKLLAENNKEQFVNELKLA
jgi:mannitol/fructose-specific phosphotransferase system IIA component (Ntr-type)